MRFEEIIPHLNKIATLYLADNRRRVGWLFVDASSKENDEDTPEAVYFVTMFKGRRMLEAPRAQDSEKLERIRERIPLSDIVRVRSIDS
jgi:hypothetical protein